MARCPSWCQPARIREEKLQSGSSSAEVEFRLRILIPLKCDGQLYQRYIPVHTRLKDELTNTEHMDTIEKRWQAHLNKFFVSVDEEWASVRDVFHETGKQVLGHKICDRKREWLSVDTRRLMEERRVAKSKRGGSIIMTRHHNYLCRRVKKSAKMDREEFIKGICQEVESVRMQNKTRAVYEGIRKITGKHAPQVKSVKDASGKIFTDPMEVKTRWKEYFEKLYNNPNVVMEDVLKEFPGFMECDATPWISGEDCKDTGKCIQRHIQCSKGGWRYIRLVWNCCRSFARMCIVAIIVQHFSGNDDCVGDGWFKYWSCHKWNENGKSPFGRWHSGLGVGRVGATGFSWQNCRC